MDINIDIGTASLAENTRWKGFGFISANGSSRLLLDYKYEQPESYNEILNYLFGSDWLDISHIKIEMGSAINSSSGTEPASMRSADEKADVTRGAGFQIAADAKKIDPDITLDMLWWSEPRWVTNSDDRYAARYKWYRETLISVYETYGLKFDYVSANRNERDVDPDWTIYLSQHLRSDTDTPYDFSAIKVVSADEIETFRICEMMLDEAKHPGLHDAVDVVGSHYTSWSDDNTRKLQKEHDKEVWFAEGSAPMSYAQGVHKYDGNGSGLSGINGALDIANRIITMYPCAGMTLYEFQPAVASYYDGACYSHKQLILANEPWSGHYLLDSGFYMALHFARFIKKGWAFVESACAADGKKGGDGHSVVDAKYSYMTCADPETEDYSTVITNTTDSPTTYDFSVSGTEKADASVDVWETKGPSGGDWNENYLRLRETITPENGGFSVTVQPYSMITVTTLRTQRGEFSERESRLLELPYYDDFNYPDEYLAARGGAPRYTTDQGGAFEVTELDGRKVLMQKITEDMHAEEWGGTPQPVTTFGDDRWFSYSVSADVMFADSGDAEKNYAAVGLRYNLAADGESGWRFALYENGKWALCLGKKTFSEGKAEINTDVNNIRIEAAGNTIKGFINGVQVTHDAGNCPIQPAGRAALYSAYYNNCFGNVKIELVEYADTYVTRLDNTDYGITYTGDWSHELMSTFRNYKRTLSTGSAGASVSVDLDGTGILICGVNKSTPTVDILLDGNIIEKDIVLPQTEHRTATYALYGLAAGHHTLTVNIKDEKLSVDSFEILLDSEQSKTF